jgi:hypothetical protein
MTSTQKIFTGIGLCLVCGVALKSAMSTSPKTNWHLVDPAAAPTTVSQAAQTTVQPAPALLIGAQGPKLASIAEPPQSGPDGKETIAPDGKETIGTDGKEVIPPDGKETIGKETLPPVGQLMPNGLPQSVDPANAGPPAEFINTNNNNPLLTEPNPQNVAGPVVSAETR